MSKGIALTIGLNSVDPKHYGGWSGNLNACEADAMDMSAIATSNKFSVKQLLTASATRSNVTKEISTAAESLQAGDILMLVYSGHGGQVPDLNNDEDDYQDETWCLYDGELIDDELYNLFSRFKEGVRILVFSDSCHSGTVTKAAYYHGTAFARTSGMVPQEVKYKFMPPDVALRTYGQNRGFYDEILKDRKLKDAPDSVKASVLLISGCQDNQYSADGTFNSLFTANVLRVWNNGNFQGDYGFFHKSILKMMPPDQAPKYFWVGKQNPDFEAQRPFTI
jgi:hypothetical protein